METVSFSHQPVLFTETIDSLDIRPDGFYIDGTAGGGGHSEAILKRLTTGHLLSIDQDPDAIAACTARLSSYPGSLIRRGNFSQMKELASDCGFTQADGILMDIGVSSHQLDTPERGFSYHTDAPLDMRMSQEGPTAADLVNTLSWQQIAEIISRYGEDKSAAGLQRPLWPPGKQRPLKPPFSWRILSGKPFRQRFGGNRDTPPEKPSRPCALQ